MDIFDEIRGENTIDNLGPGFPEQSLDNSDLVRVTSPLIDGPFLRAGQEIEELMFSAGNKTPINDGASLITENIIDPDPIVKRFNVYKDRNGNGILDDGDRFLYQFQMKVFVSKDVSYLRQAYEKTNAADYEIVLFLEDNSTDILSSKTAMIKIGKKFAENLKDLSIAEAVQREANVLDQVKEHFKDFELNFTTEEISELITTRGIVNVTASLAIGVFQAVTVVNNLLSPVFNEIGDLLKSFADTINENVKFKDHHWDPAAKIPKSGTENDKEPEMVENTDFEPVLFPGSNQLTEDLINPSEEFYLDLINQTKAIINERDQLISNTLNQFGAVTIAIPRSVRLGLGLSGNSFSEFLTVSYKEVRNGVLKLLKALEELIPQFSRFTQRIFNVVNAFICGLWNSLVDAVSGIISLVGLLLKGIGGFGDFSADAQTSLPVLLEQVDELIQLVGKLEFRKIFSEIGTLISSIDFLALANQISAERVAYFIGAVVGFVIEILVEIFFTGGTAAVAAVFRRFGRIGANLLESLTSAARKILRANLKKGGGDLLALLNSMILFLRRGTDEIIAGIRRIKEELEKIGKLAREAFQQIKKAFNLNDADFRRLREIGLDFTRFEDGIAVICKTL